MKHLKTVIAAVASTPDRPRAATRRQRVDTVESRIEDMQAFADEQRAAHLLRKMSI
jgi:hypothetical protein